MTSNAKYGIDYGMGITNIDMSTGIRYGVISRNSVDPEALNEEMEADYGDPTCPECDGRLEEYSEEDESFVAYNNRTWCDDYICEKCHLKFSSDQVYSKEPLGYYCDNDEYKIEDCLDSDLIVIKSLYFTRGYLCSPCVPGAVSLDSAVYDKKAPAAYCLGHEWFEGNKAPYPVYSVKTGRRVRPEKDEAEYQKNVELVKYMIEAAYGPKKES